MSAKFLTMMKISRFLKKEIDDILRFMKTGKFNIFDLRAKIVPICIEYKLNMDSFWKMLQVKRGAWK